jgi:hypothetical protein
MTTWSETARVESASLSIALLAVLGVDLIVLVAVAAVVFGRRRCFKRQPGDFAGAVRDLMVRPVAAQTTTAPAR